MKMDSRVRILSPEWQKQRNVREVRQTTYGVGTVGEIEIKSHQKGRKDMRTEPLRFIRVAPADGIPLSWGDPRPYH